MGVKAGVYNALIHNHIDSHTQTHSQSITNIYKSQLPHLTQKSHFWNPKPMAKPQQTYSTHVIMVKLKTHINTYSERYTRTAMSKPQTQKKKTQLSKPNPQTTRQGEKFSQELVNKKKIRKEIDIGDGKWLRPPLWCPHRALPPSVVV